MVTLRDLKTLFQLVSAKQRGATHAERIESFYGPQAKNYDAFRWRILHGREGLYRSIPIQGGEIWADFGGGTGANFETIADQVSKLRQVHLLDLSPSLLDVARHRVQWRGWSGFEIHQADVTQPVLAEASCDVVTFSYSLSMIPDWFAALEQAWRALKPGGIIGVVDFYAARKYPARSDLAQGWWRRTVFPAWFAFDNIWINADHGPYLCREFETVRFEKRTARFPNTPIHVDYFHFVGRKPKLV